MTLIDREFVHTKILPLEVSMMLRDAFNERQKSDYSEFVQVSQERAEEIINNARQVLNIIKNVIKKLE
ncbi:MAG: HEPN domain-containing protein [Firmicutes bacterium]|nr:HEPN domain-containing protein [Bacillota bacterium]